MAGWYGTPSSSPRSVFAGGRSEVDASAAHDETSRKAVGLSQRVTHRERDHVTHDLSARSAAASRPSFRDRTMHARGTFGTWLDSGHCETPKNNSRAVRVTSPTK